jgi:hypothetical protein
MRQLVVIGGGHAGIVPPPQKAKPDAGARGGAACDRREASMQPTDGRGGNPRASW